MGGWGEILFFAGILLAGWLLYSRVKASPEMFSSNNIIKSFNTLGILAIILIAFIGFMIFLLRTSA